MAWIPLLVYVALFLSKSTESARILCVASQMDSHYGEVTGATEHLQKHGHELYLVLSNIYPRPERYAQRGFKLLTYHVPKDQTFIASPSFQHHFGKLVLTDKYDFDTATAELTKYTYKDCEFMMADTELLEKIKSLNIDFMVVDGFTVCPCNVILPVYFNVPFVTLSSIIHPLHGGVHALPNHVTTFLDEFSDRMTFGQKLANTFTTIVLMIVPFKEAHDLSLLEKFNIAGTWRENVRKAELFIITRNYNLEWPVPTMPNVLTVPGLSTTSPKPLSKEFVESIESNPHGAIIMSFGSVFDKLPDDAIMKFMDAFVRLKQTVLWRLQFKPEQDIKLPPNVHLFQWLPQASLLAHPNTKLFITHCGNGGQYEATYHGVPMLGVPLFAEQPHNAFRMEQHGIGRRLRFITMTSDDLYENIMELLSNPRYKENSMRIARILKDRPMSGQEEAAYWINHVLQFGGSHLRPSTMDMPLWEFLLLDILMAVILAILFLVAFMVCIVRFICRKVIGRIASPTKKKKDQ